MRDSTQKILLTAAMPLVRKLLIELTTQPEPAQRDLVTHRLRQAGVAAGAVSLLALGAAHMREHLARG